MDEARLIFIISQPRAGSTLLQKILSNNDHVDTVSEPWLLLPLLSIFNPELVHAKYNYDLASKGFFDYLHKKEISDDFRKELKNLILNLYKAQSNDLYFIDKTPRYYEILPLLMEFFPNAKYVILKRNPFASLYSMLSIWSGNELRDEAIKTFYRDFLAAPFLINDFCEKNGSRENVKIVRYETILADPQKHVKEIYDWLKIPYDETVLDVGRNKKAAGLMGDDAQKANPLKEINPDLMDSWKSFSTKRDISAFLLLYKNYLGNNFIEKYGYEDPFAGGARPEVKKGDAIQPSQKSFKPNRGKRAVQSFFNFFGFEIRKVKKEGIISLSPEEAAGQIMSDCIAALKKDGEAFPGLS